MRQFWGGLSASRKLGIFTLIRNSVVALVVMVLLLVALVAMGSLSSLMSLPLLLTGKLALLPLMRRPLCQCCDGNCCSCHHGVVTIVNAQASSPLLNQRCCPCCLLSSWSCPPRCNGVVAVNAQGFCCCCHCNCCPHDAGIVTIVDAQMSLPLLRWCHCPCINGIVALDPQHCCCPCCNGIIAIFKLALLPSSQWHCRHH